LRSVTFPSCCDGLLPFVIARGPFFFSRLFFSHFFGPGRFLLMYSVFLPEKPLVPMREFFFYDSACSCFCFASRLVYDGLSPDLDVVGFSPMRFFPFFTSFFFTLCNRYIYLSNKTSVVPLWISPLRLSAPTKILIINVNIFFPASAAA